MPLADPWTVKKRDASDIPNKIVAPMLLWTDPPFGTGKKQSLGGNSFDDPKEVGYVLDSLKAWSQRMHPDGTIAVCIDYRAQWRIVRAMIECGWKHRGDVVWEFGLGRPRTSWWANRHNTISTFTRTESSGKFYHDRVPHEPRAALKDGYGSTKPIGSVWRRTMSNNDSERVGYPNQKPLSIIEPFILCHTDPGDLVIDPYCGSGSTGVAAVMHGRNFYGSDTSKAAVKISKSRLKAQHAPRR